MYLAYWQLLKRTICQTGFLQKMRKIHFSRYYCQNHNYESKINLKASMDAAFQYALNYQTLWTEFFIQRHKLNVFLALLNCRYIILVQFSLMKRIGRANNPLNKEIYYTCAIVVIIKVYEQYNIINISINNFWT